jgi:hypothetical protein
MPVATIWIEGKVIACNSHPISLPKDFGRCPVARADKEANWEKTIPGKGWWIMLSLYDLLEHWF